MIVFINFMANSVSMPSPSLPLTIRLHRQQKSLRRKSSLRERLEILTILRALNLFRSSSSIT